MATAKRMPQSNRFSEQKQSFCACFLKFWYISLPSSAKHLLSIITTSARNKFSWCKKTKINDIYFLHHENLSHTAEVAIGRTNNRNCNATFVVRQVARKCSPIYLAFMSKEHLEPPNPCSWKAWHSYQHQISPCNINIYSTPEVKRIRDMITQGEFSWYFNNFSLVLS